jgi:hypothetical protein
MDTRTVRQIAVLASATLLLGAFVAGPADAKKKKKKPVCATYASPDWATGAGETTIVTEAATAEAPVEVALTAAPGLGFTSTDGESGDTGETSHVYQNVQVDTATPAGGNLFVRAEFTPAFDYDLFLRLPDITAVAYEADFNPATAGGPTPVGGMEGSSAEPGASQIDGYSSSDCSGYTVDVASGISPGGEVTLKFWLEQ